MALWNAPSRNTSRIMQSNANRRFIVLTLSSILVDVLVSLEIGVLAPRHESQACRPLSPKMSKQMPYNAS